VAVARRQADKLPLTTKQLRISPRLKRIIGLYIAWEITADNLSNARWSWAASQRLIPTGERSGLLTRTAATENVSLCARMKS